MKKLLLLILFILPLVACTDSPNDDFEGSAKYLKYTKDSRVTILGLVDGYPENIIIPAKIDDKMVTKIETSAFKNATIKSIEIPISVNSFGSSIFEGCDNLEKIALPGDASFDQIFKDSGVPDKLKTLAITEASDVIEKNLYTDLGNHIEHFIISTTVVEIKSDALKGLTNLKEVTIPGDFSYYDNLLSVGINNVDTVNILEGSKVISRYSFANSNLKTINIPDSVLIIERYAFSNTKKLESVNFLGNQTLESIQEGCFFGSGINEIVIPDSVKHLGMKMFMFSKINEITFGANVETLNKESFYKCLELETIILPENINNIGDNAFGECSNLKTITCLAKDLIIGEDIFLNVTLDNIYLASEYNTKLNSGLFGFESIITWNYK